MANRYNRRGTRPLLDLPNLFSNTIDSRGFEVVNVPEGNRGPVLDEDMSLSEEFTRPANPLRFISFGSGSSGNCSYVGTRDVGVLVDAGVDNNKVVAELERNRIDIATIKGILLTHDHSDHVRYAYSLLRRNPHLRLYATPKTLNGLLRRHSISRRIKDYHVPIFKEFELKFDDISIMPFETSHDGTDNVGFAISRGPVTFVIATDMGVVTERADYYIRTADALMIEANYDSEMLAKGRYPEYLKARIRSEKGHMDNVDTARYLTQIYTPRLRQVFLCHLSLDNNTPETALRTVRGILGASAITIPVIALPRYESSRLFIL